MGLSKESPLEVCVNAGCLATPKLLKVQTVLSNANKDMKDADELPVRMQLVAGWGGRAATVAAVAAVGGGGGGGWANLTVSAMGTSGLPASSDTFLGIGLRDRKIPVLYSVCAVCAVLSALDRSRSTLGQIGCTTRPSRARSRGRRRVRPTRRCGCPAATSFARTRSGRSPRETAADSSARTAPRSRPRSTSRSSTSSYVATVAANAGRARWHREK